MERSEREHPIIRLVKRTPALRFGSPVQVPTGSTIWQVVGRVLQHAKFEEGDGQSDAIRDDLLAEVACVEQVAY